MKEIVAIVVTYNRITLLQKCIDKLLSQTVPVKKIIIIDNHSDDGTNAFFSSRDIDSKINYYRLDKNEGGAGGFSKGIEEAMTVQADYFWIMDDDTMPTSSALENLLIADHSLNSNWAFLSSNVRWIDGSSAKMNQLTTSKFWSEEVSKGVIGVKTGTFVSLLVKKVDVENVGLPISEFFIWSDDTEYTSRLSRKKAGYFVENSIIIHETASNTGADIISEPSVKRIPRYFYSYRNSFYIAKEEQNVGKFVLHSLMVSIQLVFSSSKHKMKKLFYLYKGLISGIFFSPSIKFYRQKD